MLTTATGISEPVKSTKMAYLYKETLYRASHLTAKINEQAIKLFPL